MQFYVLPEHLLEKCLIQTNTSVLLVGPPDNFKISFSKIALFLALNMQKQHNTGSNPGLQKKHAFFAPGKDSGRIVLCL